MAEVDPNVPQVSDPELEANLIRQLSIVGQLGKINVLDVVLPTISLGSVVAQTVDVRQPSFRSTDIFSQGVLIAAAAGTLLADTGALPAGTYDVDLYLDTSDAVGDAQLNIEHRNAANAANLAIWSHVFFGATSRESGPFSFGYEIGLNERLRVVVGAVAIAAGVPAVSTIFARVRA